MKLLYSTKVTADGGQAGTVRSEDGILDLKLALPAALGGKGGATNPEQLFAAGYAACFENAIIHVAQSGQKISDRDIRVVAEVGIGPNAAGGFELTVALDVIMAGVDQVTADELVKAAHDTCPYSNATRGNIDVGVTVSVH